MIDTYLDIAYINFDTAILHGTVAGKDGIRKELSQEEYNALCDFNMKQESERQAFYLEVFNR